MKNNQQINMILSIAFIQGAMDFYSLAMFYFYKDDLGLNMNTISIIQGILIIPWTIKSIFGFLIDSYQFLGFNKKGYLMASCIIEIIGFLLLATMPKNYILVVLIQVSNHCCLVLRNVVGESMLVEFSNEKWEHLKQQDKSFSIDQGQEAQRNVSMFFGSKSCGSLIFSYFSGLALEFFDKKQIFMICSLFSLSLLCMIFAYQE